MVLEKFHPASERWFKGQFKEPTKTQIDAWRSILSGRHTLVSAPTGSGKTTTLYSILNFVNNADVNIMTLEDPVEYQLTMIRQSNIREGSGMDFAGGIKSILRQDPDIIFVGEVRDSQTANMALRAAMTGHQVFTTLHTNDALGAMVAIYR